MSAHQAFAIEVQGHTAGIVVSGRGGFMFFATGRPFQALERRVFRQVAQAERAAHRALAEHDTRPRH
jgi:hypothetical protein